MGGVVGFALMPDDVVEDSNKDETRPRAHWRQSDVRRAIGAAQQAGLSVYRVEICPDGTISIVVGEASETAADPDALGDLVGL